MISLKDVLDAIDEVESMPDTYGKAEKLATFYTLRDALQQTDVDRYRAAPVQEVETVIEYDGDTEFARAINGQDPMRIWSIMDELMIALQVMNPRLYNGVIDRIR